MNDFKQISSQKAQDYFPGDGASRRRGRPRKGAESQSASMSDPAKYRTREEVEKVRTEHDPIEQVRARLLKNKWASEDALKKIDGGVRDIVNEAAEFATNDPEPDAAELWTDVAR